VLNIESAMSTIFKFGEHKGKLVDSVPSDYLKWAAENFNDNILAVAADVVWQWRETMNCHFYD